MPDTWQSVFRRGFAPQFRTEVLGDLRDALAAGDE
jgi:hypothetical protein